MYVRASRLIFGVGISARAARGHLMGHAYLQADRPLTVTTTLMADDLLLAGFTGREAISTLYEFELDLLAENTTEITFGKLLGNKVSVHLSWPGQETRHFSGICKRI